MIKLDLSENKVKLIYLGIGSNLGNRKNNINKAKLKLSQNNIFILRSSNFYETLSWPNTKNPKFLNIVLKVRTFLSASKLLKICKEIEKTLGRKKTAKNVPLECDIDILDYDQKTFKIKNNNDFIHIPHPRLHQRNFVLLPLFEIAKNWIYPNKNKKITDLLINIETNDLRTIKLI